MVIVDTSVIESWYAEWKRERIRSQRHARPEEKGIPVPGTGGSNYHSKKDSGKGGVSGGSRIVPHRYMDEGDKGKGHRREIRRKERPMVQDQISEGLWDYLTNYDTDLEGCDF